ncbi:MAG: hypothetical protein AB7O24_09920 [Kofleriaceae bacterium]
MYRALLLLMLVTPPAFADTPHQEGTYGGVVPGQPPVEKPGKPKRPPPKATLTWVGFEAKDGGAQVFLQAASPFEVEQYVDGNSLVVHTTLKRLARNVGRKVDTRFFDSPLAGMLARVSGAARASKGRPAHKAGVSIRITFKNAADAKPATTRSAVEADGMNYVYLTFPPGTAAAEPTIANPEN